MRQRGLSVAQTSLWRTPGLECAKASPCGVRKSEFDGKLSYNFHRLAHNGWNSMAMARHTSMLVCGKAAELESNFEDVLCHDTWQPLVTQWMLQLDADCTSEVYSCIVSMVLTSYAEFHFRMALRVLAWLFPLMLCTHKHFAEPCALVVFVLVSIYFFFLAKRDANAKEIDALESKKSRFFQGIFMSALNMFPIPYQAYIITTLVTIKWIFLDNLSVVAYVAGTVSGTFVGFYIYILFFEKIKNSKISSQKYMSLAIASITALVAIITLVDVLLIS